MNQVGATSIAKIVRTRTVFLIVSALSMLALGLVYAWSIFATPLGIEFGWDRTLLAYVFSISMTAFSIGALVGSFIEKHTSIMVTMIVAAVLQALGFSLTSVLASNGIWSLYLFYGVFAGFGCGIAYNTIISTVNLWFPDRVGLASGVMMMGFGLGSLILGSVANVAIEELGWGTTFIVIGVLSACILVLLAIMLKMPPLDIEEAVGAKAKRAQRIATEKKPMVKTPLFWLYSFWMFIVFGAVMTLIGSSKQGAVDLGVSAEMATLLVGFVSMMNGVARVVLGQLFDKISLRVPVLLTMICCITGIGFIAVAFLAGLPNLYYCAALLVGFSAGGIPVLASSFARERFGATEFPMNLATVNLNVVPAAILSALVIGVARPIGGDAAIYIVLFILLVAAFIDILFFFKLYYRKSSIGEERTQ